jgi:hypothetical protein
MIILIQENQYTDITISSAKQVIADQDQIIVTDNTDLFLDQNPDILDPVFILRGDSVKIFSDQFQKQIADHIQQGIGYFSLGKHYPGAYFKNAYSRAYELDGIKNYATRFDTDVMLVDPAGYRQHRDGDIVKMKAAGNVTLMSYNLNAKDDYLMTQIMEPYDMLKQNVWAHCCAGLINFSQDIIRAKGIESAVLMPFDLLQPHTAGTDIHQIVTHKHQQSQDLFGKIKQEMVTHWKTKTF